MTESRSTSPAGSAIFRGVGECFFGSCTVSNESENVF